MRATGPCGVGGSVTDPMATRIVEVRIGADSTPLLLVDGVPVDLAPGDDPEQAGMDLVADDARRAGRSVSVLLMLDGGSTQWLVQVHPDGTVSDLPDAAPTEPQRRRRPVAWLAGVSALALLAVGGYVAVTASTPGPDAPAASGVGIPTWTAELSTSAESTRPTPAPAPTPEPATALAAAAPETESEPSSPPTRATERRVRAPAAPERSAPEPSASDPVPTRPDEQPAPAPLVEQEPATAAPSPELGSSQRARSQRPSSSASASPSVSSSQRGQSGH